MASQAEHTPLSQAKSPRNHDTAQNPLSKTKPGNVVLTVSDTPLSKEPVHPPRPVNTPKSSTTSRSADCRKALSQVFRPPWFSKLRDKIYRWWQHRDMLRLWIWEILSCSLAIVAFVGMIVTIRTHEHKPLPQWPYSISINGLVAIYTTIIKIGAGVVLAEGISHLKWILLSQSPSQSLKSFVAHDNASRGLWGAFQLLWHNRGRHVSSLGALITILVLLLDPFAQQIVRYYDCQRLLSRTPATITRTNKYNSPGPIRDFRGLHANGSLRTAISTGIFGLEIPKAEFFCPTGNCSFSEPYSSVGYCSSCEDVTHKLEFDEYDPNDANYNYNFTNVTLASQISGSTLRLHRGGVRPYESLVSSTKEIGLNTNEDDVTIGMVTRIVSNMIRWDGSGTQRDKDNILRGYSCTLYPCAKTYKASISVGQLDEQLESESGLISSSFALPGYTDVWGVADLHCLDKPEEQRQILKDLGYQFNDDTRWIPYNVSLNASSDTPRMIKGPTTICTTASNKDPSTFCSEPNLLEMFAKAVPWRCIYNFGGQQDPILAQALSGTITYYTDDLIGGYADGSTQALLALWNTGSGKGGLEDVREFMRNIAASITTQIRQSKVGEPDWPSEMARGDVYHSTTCIQVQWGWTAYSALVLGMLLIFLMSTILQSRARQAQHPPAHDFKSSALTLLFHGFDYKSQRQLEEIGTDDRVGALERKVENVVVKLVRTEQGWKLSTAPA